MGEGPFICGQTTGNPAWCRLAGEAVFIRKGKVFYPPEGELRDKENGVWRITEQELDEIVGNICRHSLYAFENEIRQGFLTVPGGHRVGLAGQAVLNENGSIRNITRIRF